MTHSPFNQWCSGYIGSQLISQLQFHSQNPVSCCVTNETQKGLFFCLIKRHPVAKFWLCYIDFFFREKKAGSRNTRPSLTQPFRTLPWPAARVNNFQTSNAPSDMNLENNTGCGRSARNNLCFLVTPLWCWCEQQLTELLTLVPFETICLNAFLCQKTPSVVAAFYRS